MKNDKEGLEEKMISLIGKSLGFVGAGVFLTAFVFELLDVFEKRKKEKKDKQKHEQKTQKKQFLKNQNRRNRKIGPSIDHQRVLMKSDDKQNT